MRAKSAVVLGAQWGDEGKGKIVDVLSERFSAVARYAGGHNAGHTVIIDGQKIVLQLIPCGVPRPGCQCVIGNGVVLDPIYFLEELERVRKMGVDIDRRLFISNRAQVILPYHRMIELAAENAPGRQKIGTTSKGIGPAYEDKMSRGGLRIVDLLHPALLKTHIEAACAEKNAIAHALFRDFAPLDPVKMFEGSTLPRQSRSGPLPRIPAVCSTPFWPRAEASCSRARRERCSTSITGPIRL